MKINNIHIILSSLCLDQEINTPSPSGYIFFIYIVKLQIYDMIFVIKSDHIFARVEAQFSIYMKMYNIIQKHILMFFVGHVSHSGDVLRFFFIRRCVSYINI